MHERHIMGGALLAAAIVIVARVAPATTATPTASVTCAPSATPYCANHCEPCPTVRAGCYAVACGECHENPVCGDDAVCVPSGTGGCCTCAGVPTPTPTPTAPSVPCPGDCNGSGAVEINEIIAAVNQALGQSGAAICAGVDRNADGVIAIDELIVLVGTALRGCPAHVLADLDGVFDVDGWQSNGNTSVPVGGLAVADRTGDRVVIEIVFSVLNHLSLTADPSGGTTLTLSGGGVEGGDVAFTAHGGATVARGAEGLALTADITVDSFVTGPATLHLTLTRPNGGTPPGLSGTYRLHLQHEAPPTAFASTFDLMAVVPSSGRAACSASPDVRDDDGAVLAVLGDANCLISPSGLLWYVGSYGDDGRPLQMFGRLRAVTDVIGGEFWVAQFPSIRDRGSWTVDLQQIEIAGRSTTASRAAARRWTARRSRTCTTRVRSHPGADRVRIARRIAVTTAARARYRVSGRR
jgi:hypothetical protein